MALGLALLGGIPVARADSTPSPTATASATPAVPTPLPREYTRPVTVTPEPDGTRVWLDTTTFYPPGAQRAPAVVLAHGFGGSIGDLVAQARDLAASGYVVLAYTARGFGQSGGRVHLNDPAFEVADAVELVDLLAADPRVELDAPGDPRVGVAGASYGGALALMLAGADRRVDAVAAGITWNDLADAFFPQAAVGVSQAGPFKGLWASRFFASSVGRSVGGSAPTCGRFDPTVCRLFLAAAQDGRPSPDLVALLHAHSPRPTLGSVRAATLLVQGMTDTLFGIDQADANARGLTSAAEVAVRWTDGGHDGPSSTADADSTAVTNWLDRHLRPSGTAPSGAAQFTWSGLPPRRNAPTPQWSAQGYPGVTGPAADVQAVPMQQGRPRVLITPPGGLPASTTAVPGLGALTGSASAAAYGLAALPGQSVIFDTQPLAARLDVVGSPRVSLVVRSSAAEVTLFASLWQVTGDTATLPRRLVAPVRLAVTPGVPTRVELALPAASYPMEAGSTWRVLVTSTDAAYANSRVARVDQLTLAEPTLRVPLLPGATLAPSSERDPESRGAMAVAALLAAWFGGSAVWRRWRARREPPRADLADVPLTVTGLVKTYADGHRAVNDVSWAAHRGQVVGLLGPNGAGKTTTLRMVMGLIHPDSGTVHVLGQPVHPGAPVLAQVGALIEGPGFLPHLTGRANLEAYWAATGRDPQEAGFDAVLDVAALGDAVDRPVRSYSHGMKQRLGIAQAMLGMPDLLVLDEPTNGLDPPQIAAMRPILRAYADTGRTVVVSSHLLGEVELTCSHVVVMHAGRVLAAGSVEDLVGAPGADGSTSTSRRPLEDVFLGVIAGAAAPDPDDLRQVRAR
ncbi:MAG: alpha/beta fold hydrolase [Actinomycetales bacterium]|nr:alpha/beta fold hydrolase [Candidatus Lutibacillus vidarii]